MLTEGTEVATGMRWIFKEIWGVSVTLAVVWGVVCEESGIRGKVGGDVCEVS